MDDKSPLAGGGATAGQAMQETPILVVIGTRPEAIKLAPVVIALRQKGLPVEVCLSGQHRELLMQGLEPFELAIEHRFEAMSPGQAPGDLVARVIAAITPILAARRFRLVMVQGDTSTAMAAALAAFHCGIAVAHVEAGLRSGDLSAPWPEEMNRRLIGQLAEWHFAPTAQARRNLIAEGIRDQAIAVTGNTVIDALHMVEAALDRDSTLGAAAAPILDAARGRTLILVTVHRRESLGTPLLRIAEALRSLADPADKRLIVLPLHPNPQLMPLRTALEGTPGIMIVPPLAYPPFVTLLRRADVILSDSGGIQEEAAALGKPVLVLREKTERPELLAGGNGILAGTSTEAIVRIAEPVIADAAVRAEMTRPHDAFGDGHAADRIAEHLARSV